MNEDNITNTTKGIEKIGWGIIKWTFGVVVSLGILGAVFWALFYSVSLANFKAIISLRNWYQNTFWKVEAIIKTPRKGYPPFNPLYTVQPLNDPIYKYELAGTYTDHDTQTLRVKAYNGKIYSFTLVGQTINNGVEGIQNLIPTLPNQDLSKIGISVAWDDKRSLGQILSDANLNIPLNKGSAKMSLFIFLSGSK